jgi:CRISP-associated protein Cas1
LRHLLNTLFVTTQGSYLSREGETVVVSSEHERKLQIPLHTLGGIVCFGQVSCSPPLIGVCAERQVSISFLTENGKFLARIQGPVSGNVLLRREQFRQADDERRSASLAQAFVVGKVANSKIVLQRGRRDHPGNGVDAIATASASLSRVLAELRQPQELALVRGREGEAARIYFGVFDHLITAQKESFFFRERSRRPPLDNVNALLSFLYTLLVHDIVAALESVGLDPAVGYLHRDRPGRPGLALDLMEEFRAFLVDRLVLSLINRQQVSADDFRTSESGGVVMDDSTRKASLIAWQKRKQEEIQHPFLGEKVPAGLLPYVQALLLARHLRGDLDGYPPFIWR